MSTNLARWDEEFRPALRSSLGIDDNLTVIHVAEGSPAGLAAVEPGDRILAIGGRGLGADADSLFDMEAAIRDAGIGTPTKFETRRDNVALEQTIAAEPACAFAVNLAESDEVNAWADGGSIFVTRGMMRFATDDELAVVIAHELAHNAYGHVQKQIGNQAGGAVAGLLIDLLAVAAGINTGGVFTRAGAQAGALAYAKDFEAEADYVALYMLAASDLPIDKAPYFWRRMAALRRGHIDYSATHPTSPERFLAMEQTIAEIDKKRAAGEPLVPTLSPEVEQAVSDCIAEGRTAQATNDIDWAKVKTCEERKSTQASP